MKPAFFYSLQKAQKAHCCHHSRKAGTCIFQN